MINAYSPMRFVFLILAILICSFLVAAQKVQEKEPVKITSDDFSRARDLLDKGKSVFVFRKKPTYRLKHITKRTKPIPAKPHVIKAVGNTPRYDLPVDANSAEVWKRLGVTIWRLAPNKKTAADIEAATIESASQKFEPTRVSAETKFAQGDKVRLSFESPNGGYLYVIDRELYADGTVGEPKLIFPTMMARGGNNLIAAGQMIDIPAQSDRVSYFTLESKNKNWRGELLTVIISPQPLKDIETPDGPSPIATALVDAIENKYLKSVSEYEQQGSEGNAYTKAEKKAGGSLTRELTQKDPFPQTMFRVKMRQREPMLVSFGLTVK